MRFAVVFFREPVVLRFFLLLWFPVSGFRWSPVGSFFEERGKKTLICGGCGCTAFLVFWCVDLIYGDFEMRSNFLVDGLGEL